MEEFFQRSTDTPIGLNEHVLKFANKSLTTFPRVSVYVKGMVLAGQRRSNLHR